MIKKSTFKFIGILCITIQLLFVLICMLTQTIPSSYYYVLFSLLVLSSISFYIGKDGNGYIGCKHDYILINHFEIKSEAEKQKAMGYKPNTHSNFTSTYISHYKCENCGKLKIIKG